MKNRELIKRTSAMVLSLVMALTLMVPSVKAETGSTGNDTANAVQVTSEQDGLEATLSFTKTEYAANEDIATTLTVKNNNSYTVKDIQTEITLPDGIMLKLGSLTQEKLNLTADGSKVQDLTFIKIVQATEPSADDTNSPETGDDFHIGIFAVLMILSGGTFLVIAIRQKKLHIKGIMSVVFCFALLGAMVGAMLPMTAFAASEQKSFTVEETVKIDGKDTTIKATVTYEFVQYSDVTVTDGTGTGLYAEGETVTITADEAPEGKHFTGWTVENGDVTLADSNNSTTTFVMPAEDVEVKANYDVNTYTITVETGTNGEITPNAAEVQYGGEQKFEITPVTGYHIVDVEIDGVSKGAISEYTFSDVKETHTIKATFAIDTFTITATAGANGTITETATVNYGDSKTFTITPDTGYHVADVKVDDVSVGAKTSYEFKNVTANHKIEVSFAIDTFTIEVTSGENGAISPAGEVSVNYGENQTFTITPNAHYHIVDVEIDGVSKGAITEYTFENVKETHTIKATFAIDTFMITATAGANGSITESAKLNTGDSKTFTMTANSGYGVKDVKVDGTSVGPVTSYTFENVNGNHTIEVVFDKATTVSTAQDFRDAVKQDGIIILANDITLDNSGNVYISKNVIIHGNGHTIFMPVYSGTDWLRAVSVMFTDSAEIALERCNFSEVNGTVWLYVWNQSCVSVFDCKISSVSQMDTSEVIFYSGVIDNLYQLGPDATLTIENGVFKENVGREWRDSLSVTGYLDLNVHGGTFYFDVTRYLDTTHYQATQTKDADGVDIWVVTAK